MKILLFSLCLIATALGSPLDECAWGESYWCSSLKTAKQCGAVDHCISTVWSQKTITDDSDICEYCENFVGDIRKFLLNNQTLDNIKNFLDAFCNMIPISELADQCDDYVNNDLDEIFKMIDSKLDPKAICAALGFCQGFQDKVEHFKPNEVQHLPLKKGSLVGKWEAGKGDICADCKKLVQDMKDLITDKTTEEQLEQLFKERVCANLGSLQDECNTLVEQYVPELLELLAGSVDPNMTCTALGFCQGGKPMILIQMKLKKSPLYKAAQLANSEECVFCKAAMEELQQLDRNQQIQGEIKDFLKNELCTHLGSLQQACVDTVDEYGQYLFEFLANELDPDTRCRSLGFCTDSQQFVSGILRQAMPVQKPAVASFEQSAECVLCEFVMKELKDLIGNNATEEEILAALEKICGLLPSTIKTECDDFIEQYGPVILQLLLGELDPEQVCTILGLCSQSSLATSKNQVVKMTGVASDETCIICETVIQYVDSLLEENSTEEDIKKVLEKVCNYLPDTYATECKQLIDQYEQIIIDMIVKEASPEEICTAIGMCSSQKKQNSIPLVDIVPIVPVKVPLLGERECTYGPSYWCSSKENAKKCKAEAHCEKHGWNF